MEIEFEELIKVYEPLSKYGFNLRGIATSSPLAECYFDDHVSFFLESECVFYHFEIFYGQEESGLIKFKCFFYKLGSAVLGLKELLDKQQEDKVIAKFSFSENTTSLVSGLNLAIGYLSTDLRQHNLGFLKKEWGNVQ